MTTTEKLAEALRNLLPHAMVPMTDVSLSTPETVAAWDEASEALEAWEAERAAPVVPENYTEEMGDAYTEGFFDGVEHAKATPAAPAPDLTDAYAGAREDLAIWKKRALEAEDLNRMFMREINGPTFMGEPALAAAGHAPVPLTEAARDVLAERKRQISVEGWTPEHDDEHRKGALAHAAGCYATWAFEAAQQMPNWVPVDWPWDDDWWKPCEPRRMLVKSCALALAEIERLDRIGLPATKEDSEGPQPLTPEGDINA